MTKIPKAVTPVSGDGYSRMFEPEHEPDLSAVPEDLREFVKGDPYAGDPEMRALWTLLRSRSGGGLRMALDIERLTPIFGVWPTPETLWRAVDHCDRWAEVEASSEAKARQDGRQHDPLVYYMLHGGLVKIGTSGNLTTRLEAIGPERLLAVEPGGMPVERARHRQFAEWHSHGEWFLPSSTLDAHMERVRTEFADLWAPWSRWSPPRPKALRAALS